MKGWNAQNQIRESRLLKTGAKMQPVTFEWDETKASANLVKHGVSFEEAKTVFDDQLYVDFYDPDHSADESRYIIIGESSERRLLIVSYTERNNAIRLISARELTSTERKAYEEN